MEMLTNKELEEKVLQWAVDKDLLHSKNAMSQSFKLVEEVGELFGAHLKNNIPELKDAIGDIQVVLIILQKQLDLNITTVDYKFNQSIIDVDGSFVRMLNHVSVLIHSITMIRLSESLNELRIYDLLKELNKIAIYHNTTLNECLNIAWNTIKNRTGKTVGGTFIKD